MSKTFETPRKKGKEKAADEDGIDIAVSPVKKLAAKKATSADFSELNNKELFRLVKNCNMVLDDRHVVPAALTELMEEVGTDMAAVCAAVRKSHGRNDGELAECVYAVGMHTTEVGTLEFNRPAGMRFKVDKHYFSEMDIDDCLDTVFKPQHDDGVDLFYIEYKEPVYVFHYIQVKHGLTQIGRLGASTYALSRIRRRLRVGRMKIEKWFKECGNPKQYSYEYHLFALGGLCQSASQSLHGGSNGTKIHVLNPSDIKELLLSVMGGRLGTDLGNLSFI